MDLDVREGQVCQVPAALCRTLRRQALPQGKAIKFTQLVHYTVGIGYSKIQKLVLIFLMRSPL